MELHLYCTHRCSYVYSKVWGKECCMSKVFQSKSTFFSNYSAYLAILPFFLKKSKLKSNKPYLLPRVSHNHFFEQCLILLSKSTTQKSGNIISTAAVVKTSFFLHGLEFVFWWEMCLKWLLLLLSVTVSRVYSNTLAARERPTLVLKLTVWVRSKKEVCESCACVCVCSQKVRRRK